MTNEALQYEELGPISRPEARDTLGAAVPGTIGLVLLRTALHDPDPAYIQGLCMEWSSSPDVWDRRNCATALGHLARIHGCMDVEAGEALLATLSRDPDTAPWAEAALGDIDVFVRRGPMLPRPGE